MITREELIESLQVPQPHLDGGGSHRLMSEWEAECLTADLLPLIGYHEGEAFTAGWDAALASFAGARVRAGEAWAGLAATVFDALNWRKR